MCCAQKIIPAAGACRAKMGSQCYLLDKPTVHTHTRTHAGQTPLCCAWGTRAWHSKAALQTCHKRAVALLIGGACTRVACAPAAAGVGLGPPPSPCDVPAGTGGVLTGPKMGALSVAAACCTQLAWIAQAFVGPGLLAAGAGVGGVLAGG